MEEKKFKKALKLGSTKELLVDAMCCLEDLDIAGNRVKFAGDLAELFELRPNLYSDMKAIINRHLNNVYCEINNL